MLYRFLPELRYVQLPLRWLLCLNVGFALLVTMADRRWLLRALACLVMLAVLASCGIASSLPGGTTRRLAEMLDNQQDGSGYEGIDEYVPNGADVYEIKKDARRVTFEGAGSARIHITDGGPSQSLSRANVSQPGKLVLKLFNYPAWKVEVNDHPVPTGTLKVTGQMVIPVEAGENQVQVTFARTRDRQSAD